MATEVLVIPHLHFDTVWRRCFDRPARKHGLTVRSYAQVEERCLERWLELAGRGYTFSEGQACILRKYLERNPGRRDTIREMARDGRLNVVLAGEVVQDTVLPAAEGLVRNFLTAWPFYRDLVGEDHPALKLAWLEDAFGNSPNYPQVLRGVGAEVACKLTYRTLGEDVWVGIDGTKIPCFDRAPAVGAGGFEKNRPCPACRGQGCRACRQSGMIFVPGFDEAGLRRAFEAAAAAEGPYVVLGIMAEEILPDPRIADLIDEFHARFAGKATFRFANQTDIAERFGPVMRQALAGRDDKPSVDLNPAMPGCMVSRIGMKQRVRAVTYRLLAAEAALAGASWQAGIPAAPPPALAEAWRNLTFCQFHDAVTGTHIDNAFVELSDMLDAAEKVALRYAPVPAGGRKTIEKFTPVRAGKGRKKLGRLTVKFDRAGIVSILCEGQDVFGQVPAPIRVNRHPRIGELVMEHDFGDAWGQRIEPLAGVQHDMTAILLGEYNTAVEAAPGAIRWRGAYRGHDPKVKRLKWTVTARPSEDGRRIDFVTEIDWDTASRRIRVLVPVRSEGDTATYEVPFGFIDRTFDASQLDYSQWKSNTMEFPTLHWVRKAVDARSGVAVLNKGLPCNRYTPGRFDLSLLRSPEWEFCVAEPGTYEFWDTDGQRDAGKQRFEYSLLPYYEGLSDGDLTRIGYRYNPCPRPWFRRSPWRATWW
ncbi:MAG: glycosyl hydrolase [Planctomycetota bacterium]|nr:glycosyl hydrolase [Planctomycetota bacterium]